VTHGTAEDPIALCLAGTISAEVALARLVLAGATPDAIAHAVATKGEGGNPRRRRLVELLATRRDALDEIRAMVERAGVDHAPVLGAEAGDRAVAAIAALFDRAVAQAPEGSVAAFSLGDPAILAVATEELLRWLAAENLIRRDGDVLDLGCGIGRVAAAIAPHCRSVLGLDVSQGMVAEARRRHEAVPNLRFAVTPGVGLAALPGDAFDLILAVDSFPYLVQAGGGIAERHVADAARLLRGCGALAILNLSYRADAGADAADARQWAARYGFDLAACDARPFTLWDGRAFVLLRRR
jgi:SAM-dependent methyltransferase